MAVNINDKQIAALVRCAEAGLNQKQTAEAISLSQTTVHRASVEYGIKFYTYRLERDGKRKSIVNRRKEAAPIVAVDARRQPQKKQIQSINGCGSGLSTLQFNRKRIRQEKALENLENATTIEEKKEISYGWNILEHEIEMARLGKRPNLPMDLRQEITHDAKEAQQQKIRIAAENKRKIILSCFSEKERLTAADISQKLKIDGIELTVQTISSFMDGMAKMGRLDRYRNAFTKKGKNYWYYFLPQ